MPGHLEAILIGDNPFIGVDHLSQERARDRLSRQTSDREARVLRAAFRNGASGFVFSTHPTHLEVFRLLNETTPDLAFDLYPLLPYAQGYVRTATEKGMIGMVSEVMGQLSLGGKVKALVGGGISAITMNPNKMLATFVDMELDRFLRAAPPRAKLKTVFLHEIVVDLAIALQLSEIVKDYVDHVNEKYKVKAGLVTRNFQRLVDFLGEAKVPMESVAVMTPFNKIGFQMNPSREASEKSLAQARGLEVTAMSVLASGLISPEEASEYLSGLENLSSVVVGVSSEEHAADTFGKLRGLITVPA